MSSAAKLRPRADKVDCKTIGSLSVTNGHGNKVFKQSLFNWGMHFQKPGCPTYCWFRFASNVRRTHNQIIAIKLWHTRRRCTHITLTHFKAKWNWQYCRTGGGL